MENEDLHSTVEKERRRELKMLKKKKNKNKEKKTKGTAEKDGEVRAARMEEENEESIYERGEVAHSLDPTEGGESELNNDEKEMKRIKRRERLAKEAARADKRGVCYLSRIPPHMDPGTLRQLFAQYGEIQRLYLVPEDRVAPTKRKRTAGFQRDSFSEGWVEFAKKSVAKRVANMLNGEQIGGKKKSLFYYDLWNIKYLSKFKWDDLIEEIAYKNATREQKLALELSAAKKERDFYLSKVDQSRALTAIQERLTKKKKVQEDSVKSSEHLISQKVAKVIRQFPQKQPIPENATQNKRPLSKDILAGVFGAS